MSSGLLTNTRLYFDALGAFREGDILPIVERFAQSAMLAVDNGRALAADITAAQRDFRVKVGAAQESVSKLLDLLPREPAITAEMAAEYTGVSQATAYRAVQRLQDAGILSPAGKVRGVSVWIAGDIIAALDDLAARAGRRIRH
ncbi:hypothetical protein ACFRJ9_13735 [Paenarthrobacter sp. NPDC056912]|uniref:hypothetical protein n=1 Tax=Paenarthrobacter sp. NPDC056912 TaxID=3345965 RepID=UPI0036735B9C